MLPSLLYVKPRLSLSAKPLPLCKVTLISHLCPFLSAEYFSFAFPLLPSQQSQLFCRNPSLSSVAFRAFSSSIRSRSC
ncbi:hypothetical protein SESBI_03921 [Sesbania bispinosa]|nr:hypothetical protein SESBI_03921 [Sesbania bispinosa]